MKYLLLIAGVLFLAGCCNGTGPGPRAFNDTNQSETMVVTEQLS